MKSFKTLYVDRRSVRLLSPPVARHLPVSVEPAQGPTQWCVQIRSDIGCKVAFVIQVAHDVQFKRVI